MSNIILVEHPEGSFIDPSTDKRYFIKYKKEPIRVLRSSKDVPAEDIPAPSYTEVEYDTIAQAVKELGLFDLEQALYFVDDADTQGSGYVQVIEGEQRKKIRLSEIAGGYSEKIIVSTQRDFRVSDAGKLLLLYANVNLPSNFLPDQTISVLNPTNSNKLVEIPGGTLTVLPNTGYEIIWVSQFVVYTLLQNFTKYSTATAGVGQGSIENTIPSVSGTGAFYVVRLGVGGVVNTIPTVTGTGTYIGASNGIGAVLNTLPIVSGGGSYTVPGVIDRYYGVSADNLHTKIDAGGPDLAEAVTTIKSFNSESDTDPYDTKIIDHGGTPTYFYWVVRASQTGANSVHFTVNGGLLSTFPQRTVNVDGTNFIIYRSGQALGSNTYVAQD